MKIIEMLGSEGPKTSDEMVERLPFPQTSSSVPSTNLRAATSFRSGSSFKPMMPSTS